MKILFGDFNAKVTISGGCITKYGFLELNKLKLKLTAIRTCSHKNCNSSSSILAEQNYQN
jgi:hypothetical protein